MSNGEERTLLSSIFRFSFHFGARVRSRIHVCVKSIAPSDAAPVYRKSLYMLRRQGKPPGFKEARKMFWKRFFLSDIKRRGKNCVVFNNYSRYTALLSRSLLLLNSFEKNAETLQPRKDSIRWMDIKKNSYFPLKFQHLTCFIGFWIFIPLTQFVFNSASKREERVDRANCGLPSR